MRRVLTATVLALVLLAVAIVPALAHAELVRSDPPNGAVLGKPPAQVELWFSEGIASGTSQARVLDAQGRPVQGVQIQFSEADPTLMSLTLPPLPDGAYQIAYDVVSADDNHAEEGQMSFSVGVLSARGASGASLLATPPAAEVALRWLSFVAVAGLLGGFAVMIFVLGAGGEGDAGRLSPELAARIRRRVVAWAAWCGVAALVAELGLLIWQAAGLAATGGQSTWPRLLLALVTGTPAGLLWLIREVLLVAVAGVLFSCLRGLSPRPPDAPADPALATTQARPALVVAGVLSVAVMGTQSFSSHATALTENVLPAILADWLHLVAAGLWAGSLLALAAGLLPLAWRERNTPAFGTLLRAGWRPFGTLAAFSVAVLVATGLYSLGRQVASIDALLTTFYGRALLAKSGLVLAAGAFGLLNSGLLHPRVAAPLARLLGHPAGWTPLPIRRLPALVLAEIALVLLVFVATGAITSASPARGPQFALTAQPVLISDRPLEPLLTMVAIILLAAILLMAILLWPYRARPATGRDASRPGVEQERTSPP